jgi:hypothetical protein
VAPREATLRGSDAALQIVVTGKDAQGRQTDLTRSVVYELEEPASIEVSSDGLVRPRADGRAVVTVRLGRHTNTLSINVEDYANTRPVWFPGEVVPIFTRQGCNNGACHGKASGQNGFKLSLLGFEPKLDYDALVREGRGRRVFPAAPQDSLLLLKSTGKLPHGGGQPVATGSAEYRTLLRWLTQGMPYETGREPSLERIEVEPAARLLDRKSQQQLRVTAHYSDGSNADVTPLAQFQSNAVDLATVDERGLVQVLDGVGVAAIMARYGGQVCVMRATIPLGAQVPPWEPPASQNLIDTFVFRKLKELGLPPSADCTDAEFARRSSLDICGVLPQPDAVQAFEEQNDPAKRSRWIDQLLERPEYADFFALKWSAILRNKRAFFQRGTDPVTFAFHTWIRQSLAQNKSYDRFVSEIVAARGDAFTNPPVAWYRPSTTGNNDEKVDDTAQLFLGLRIQCARCHHHPFEKWGQSDYYGLAAFFSRVGRKAGSDPVTPRVYTLPTGLARNPTDGKQYKPKPLDAPELAELGPYDDPRQALADWLGRADNPFLARALVNRYWKHFFGRGLVEPEDDMRVTNPPSNPELLDALADDFRASGYDLKHLVRTIATSRAYDRSSLPNEFNLADRQNFARYYPRRLPAEVLLDAINSVAGTQETFNGLPKGFRAVRLPDEGFASYFLEVFGRPKRESVCECERVSEASLTQSLHLINSGEIQQKLNDGTARTASWAAGNRPENDKLDELYRLCYSRLPTDEERSICMSHLARRRKEGQARQGYDDLLWALINTKEFLLNH